MRGAGVRLPARWQALGFLGIVLGRRAYIRLVQLSEGPCQRPVRLCQPLPDGLAAWLAQTGVSAGVQRHGKHPFVCSAQPAATRMLVLRQQTKAAQWGSGRDLDVVYSPRHFVAFDGGAATHALMCHTIVAQMLAPPSNPASVVWESLPASRTEHAAASEVVIAVWALAHY